jgi:hypothetical protein
VHVLEHDVGEVAARLLEQEPPHGLAVEVTVDLVLRPVREDAASCAQLLGEELLGVTVRSSPLPLGASLALRLLGHDDLHGSASS